MSDTIKKYIDATMAFGKATDEGNNKVGNKQYKIIQDCYLQLKEQGKLNELKEYLNADNDFVCIWVATHLLNNFPKESERALQEIASKDNMASFIAENTLNEWRNGNLKL